MMASERKERNSEKEEILGVMDISCAIFEWFVCIGHFVCWSRRSVLQGV